MTAQSSPADARSAASRVAKWLLEKGHADDALQVLTAWAVTGPNDATGHQLLAEALRIDPSAALAKSAFERMEGMVGDHALLDAAIARFTRQEIQRLEAEIKKPSFRRAQVGFNNNVKFRAQVFHIQTEDSGLDKPHVITHLFADGGRVIKSHKRIYAKEVTRADVAQYVRALMKAQHMEMVLMLRDGKFDEILDGKRVGGMDTLQEPPSVDVRKMTKEKKDGGELAGPASQIARAQMKVQEATPPPAPSASKAPPPPKVHFKMHMVRALWGAPETFAPAGEEVILGRHENAAMRLEGEKFCAPHEAILHFRDGKLQVEDIEGGNGVFIRIRTPVEVGIGDEFIVGDELVRVVENPIPDVTPGEGPTYFYSSPTWLSSFRIVQIYEGDREGACVVARGTTVIVGRSVADLVFANDPLVEEQHCLVEEQAGVIVLTDLESRTGVFVRAKGEHELVGGDEIMVGRTRMRVEIL